MPQPPTGSTTPTSTRWFVWTVVVCGFAGAVASVPLFQADSPGVYVLATALTLITAVFKVGLSPVRAGASVSAATAGVVFVLVRFGTPAAVPVAIAAVWVQERARVITPNPALRTAFSMASVTLSVLAAGLVHGGLVSRVPGLPAVGAVAAAVSLYFVVNSLLVAGAVGPTRGVAPLRYWRDTCLLAAPYYLLSAGVGGGAAMAADRPGEGLLALLLGVPAYLAYRGFATYLSQLHDRQRETEQALAQGLRITEALSLAITAQHGASHEGMHRLQAFGLHLARVAGLDEPRQRAVAMAVLLRNIGMLAVSRDLLAKTDPLTPAELSEVQAHPRTSAAILGPAQLPDEVLAAIESHHERWDGTGYPAGLAGRDIPLAGRIVALLDAYDALVQAPAVSRSRSADEVVSALRLEAGRALDPVLTAWFVELLSGEASAAPPIPTDALTADGDFHVRHRDAVLERIARRRRERELLYDVAEVLGSALPLADGLALVESKLGAILPFSRCQLHLSTDPEHPPGDSEASPVRRVAVGPRTHLVAHLRDGDETLGALTVWRDVGDPFEDADRRLLARIADLLARKVGDVRRLEAAAHTVLLDPLTGLANRQGIEQVAERELQRARRESAPVSLLLVDVDGFAGVNATFGHAIGDRLLRLIGETLRESVRPYDTCARMAADQFAVLLPRCPVDGAEARARHLAGRVSGLRLHTATGQVRVDVSTATATYPGDGQTLQSLLDRAAPNLRPETGPESASSPGQAA